MATDILVLGGIAFDDWSTPQRMPFGGKQAMAVHKLPGGARVVDTLGPDEDDIRFTGIMYGNGAFGTAEALHAMRIAGATVPLTFGGQFYNVIIEDVKLELQRFPQLTGYHVSCMVVSNPLAGVLGAIATTLDSIVGADMATMQSIVGL